MVRTREVRARSILEEEVRRVGWPEPSSCTIKREKRAEASNHAWWSENLDPNESSTTARNLAYFRAYHRIANGLPLYAEGIPLEGKRLWMDRSVMKRLERDGYVAWIGGKDAYFEITEAGRTFMRDDAD